MSPKQVTSTLPNSVSTKTISLASMKPAASENATPVGKNVQRIRLKKRSEPAITPLSLACAKLNTEAGHAFTTRQSNMVASGADTNKISLKPTSTADGAGFEAAVNSGPFVRRSTVPS